MFLREWLATLKFLCIGVIMKVKTNKEIFDFLLKYAEIAEVELVDVEFNLSKNPELNIYVDTEDGVDLDTLEKFHNLINDRLDELDPSFGQPYTLNVSSPGLDRPFKTDRDFERNLGLDVEIKLFAPMKGKKYFEGTLTGYDGKTIVVLIDGEEVKFELSKISKINQAIKFD